jgi:Mg2+-importing ATPase
MGGQPVWTGNSDAVCKELASSPFGLSSSQAHARLVENGPNEIQDKDKKEWFDILASQFASPLLLILIFASIISVFLGELFDTAIIIIIIAASVLLGFVQEYKSERVLSTLKRYFSYKAVVLRNGGKARVDSRKLVAGDIVFVRLGDIVPADMRILETDGITVDEGVLTGESRPVQKNAMAQAGAAQNPQEIRNGLFMGTTIVDGYAKAIVVATGQGTYFGRTAAVFSSKVPESDFQLGIRKFGSLLLRVITVLTVIVFLSNYALGHGDKNPLADSALFALAIAIGIAPEALPAIITVTLSNGSMHMAKKSVIIKKLAAIEDLGNMDILCTDKTGTLTAEGIHVEGYVDLDKRDSHDVFQYALLCNAAVGTTHVRGSPIDVAIKKHGQQHKIDVSRFKRIGEVPFDFSRRRMGAVVREARKTMLIVKGEPESVLACCTKVRMSDKLYATSVKRALLRRMIVGYNKDGMSTIGVAYREISPKSKYGVADELGLVFIGFVLLSNPPKPTVRATLARLARLNIRLKVLTGDDPLVTMKIASLVGFKPQGGRVVLGHELEKMNGKEFASAVEEVDIFARVTPQQKMLIVEALRANGHVVGFLGDGINDAPALRTADVGISVDTAADVAKEASHIILLKKSLDVVCDGVEEGRRIFNNVTKYILNTMSANQGNMVTVMLSSFFLPFIPLLPSQILLNNLMSDLPLLTVASDNVDAAQVKRPKKWDIGMIMRFMVFFGIISTVFDLLLILIMHFFMNVDVAQFRTAWFLESVLSEMIIVFSLRTRLPFFKSMPSWILIFASIAACAASFGVIYFAPIADAFHFVPLDASVLMLIGGILAAYVAATEIGKVIFFSRIEKEIS